MAPKDFGVVGKILRRDLPAFLRASYASLYVAGMEMGKLGYSMDLKLSTNEAKVFFSAATGAVVCFRGSVNASDWAENLQLGVGIFGSRHQRSKALMEKVQAKYGPAHAIGHSLEGHLAEHSGARGLILTVDKAVGVRDLGAQTNPNELDIRARGDAVSALSHGGLREEVVPDGYPAAAPHLLPGPIRAPLGISDRKKEVEPVPFESKSMQLGRLLVIVDENTEGANIEGLNISESFRACLRSRFLHLLGN
ncbi:hypothetical protein T492DRAFT_848686 [Pavlovales sp. CCMP2436]|nr:hypothetical protein T492DRAFT_848686 [Pavlovales sp. CCMP2436]